MFKKSCSILSVESDNKKLPCVYFTILLIYASQINSLYKSHA